MDVTKPSVTKALANLAQKGLVDVVDRDARLTSEGHRLAEEALAKHLFFEEDASRRRGGCVCSGKAEGTAFFDLEDASISDPASLA